MAKDKDFVKEITPRGEDFSRWYIDVITRAKLMDYAPVRGCIVFRPDGYELWEACQRELDRRFKETGHRNAYFPLLIPESFFQKEKDHIEGFNPELPWVTHVGDEALEERLAVRPTSETVIGYMYSQWVQSYRDLPILINQWANVVRWEKRTLPFLRTSEFLWQEGHTAHVDEEDARAETDRMLEVYRDFVESVLAIPVILGRKTPSEKFPGAVDTYSLEAMMGDGRALQAGTSHYLGDKFARSFDIQYLDRDNIRKYAHTTSWGMTTRILGALIMVHGDDRGLRLPPRIAPTQAIIVPIGPTSARERVLAAAAEVRAQLQRANVRVQLDADENTSPGWKFNEYEMRGIPIRIEIGPRDLAAGQAICVRRDTGEKRAVALNDLPATAVSLLEEIQSSLYAQAATFLREHQAVATDIATLQDIVRERRGFALSGWCGDPACEARIKDETGATSRNIPFSPPQTLAQCVACDRPAAHTVWFARAY